MSMEFANPLINNPPPSAPTFPRHSYCRCSITIVIVLLLSANLLVALLNLMVEIFILGKRS